MKYRKKPIVIEAVQFLNNDSSISECLKFLFNDTPTQYYIDLIKKQEYLFIETLEGPIKASFGDYIIKGIHGEFYPCKPDIFEKTYENIE